jgi:2-methylisocitrate lyase-like PEP mutase family enzyme
LRTLRPDKTFTISLRTSFDGKDPAELGARLSAYRDAGADHIMVQPEDRDADDWIRTVEKIARAASVH